LFKVAFVGKGAKTQNYTDVEIANLQTDWNNRMANGILSRLWNKQKIVPTEMNVCETTEYSEVGKNKHISYEFIGCLKLI